jgi:hypothetical protein
MNVNPKRFDTPIVFAVYNRPAHTSQSIAQLAAVQPSQLFVVADGPKEDVAGDGEKCQAAIDEIRRIEWPGDVHWNIATTNLGCRTRIQTGLSWVFDQVDCAIVVEDDCVVDPSFFPLAGELLERYRHDPRIGVISAQRFGPPWQAASYHASKYPLISGWASWRRTWQLYEPQLESWDAVRATDWLDRYLDDPLLTAYWRAVFDREKASGDTWDYQLTYSCWRNGVLTIHPSVNLVRNIGFGPDATHTFVPVAQAELQSMRFPLVHPDNVDLDPAYEARVAANCFITPREAFRRAKLSMTKQSNGHTSFSAPTAV